MRDQGAAAMPSSYYEATASREAAAAPLKGSASADVCVVGGGYAGLSAALELRARGFDVVLLEALRIGSAASGRNGGQVLPGFGVDADAALAGRLPGQAAQAAWRISAEAVDLVRARIERHRIACDWRPGCLTLAVRPRKVRELRHWFDRASRMQAHALRWIGPQDIGHWIASTRYRAGVFDPHAGHLHPLRYCLGLAAAARAAGVRMHEDTRATALDHGPQVVVRKIGRAHV